MPYKQTALVSSSFGAAVAETYFYPGSDGVWVEVRTDGRKTWCKLQPEQARELAKGLLDGAFAIEQWGTEAADRFTRELKSKAGDEMAVTGIPRPL